jgi:hypothetical protein
LPTTVPKCSRITAADPNPASAATCSMASSVERGRKWKMRSRHSARPAAAQRPQPTSSGFVVDRQRSR